MSRCTAFDMDGPFAPTAAVAALYAEWRIETERCLSQQSRMNTNCALLKGNIVGGYTGLCQIYVVRSHNSSLAENTGAPINSTPATAADILNQLYYSLKLMPTGIRMN